MEAWGKDSKVGYMAGSGRSGAQDASRAPQSGQLLSRLPRHAARWIFVRRRVTAVLVVAAVAAVAPVAANGAQQTFTLTSGQKVYRGTGNRSLGALRVVRTAKLTWRHPSGGRLILLTNGGHGRRLPLVTTTVRTGSVRLRAGTYRDLRVQARGGWRITITALQGR
jgi:hypothetical protein